MSILPEHCRAARALLDWTLDDLSRESGVAVKTIVSFEKGQRTPFPRTLRDIREAFARAGVTFSNGDRPGVYIDRARASLTAQPANGEHTPASAPMSPAPSPRKRKREGIEAAA